MFCLTFIFLLLFCARIKSIGDGLRMYCTYVCVTFLAPVCCNVSIFEAAKKRRRRLFPEKKNSVCVSLFLKVAWPFQGWKWSKNTDEWWRLNSTQQKALVVKNSAHYGNSKCLMPASWQRNTLWGMCFLVINVKVITADHTSTIVQHVFATF